MYMYTHVPECMYVCAFLLHLCVENMCMWASESFYYLFYKMIWHMSHTGRDTTFFLCSDSDCPVRSQGKCINVGNVNYNVQTGYRIWGVSFAGDGFFLCAFI